MSFETILFNMNAKSNSFTIKEKKIFKTLYHDPSQFIHMSIQELSSLTDTSVATIIRFFKKCGYDSYADFKFQLKQCLTDAPETVARNQSILLNNYISLWNQLLSNISDKELGYVLSCLLKYKHILIIGVSSSGYTAQEFSTRFMRLGFKTHAIVDEHFMMMQAALTDEDYLVIAISLSGETTSIHESLRLAKMNHASTILLTNHQESRCANFADQVIVTPKRAGLIDGYSLSNQIPQLMFIDCLYEYTLKTHPNLQENYEKTLNVIAIKAK